MWGLLAVPIFNDNATIGAQLLGLFSILFWVFITSFAIWYAIKITLGIRVDEGVDISECGLEAYPELTRTE